MEKTTRVSLATQLQEDYLAYSMSVILGRAIPRLTDGCKPISRRILTAMKMLNLRPDGRFMKSARVEGEVMGKYSPHGSSYSSIVTLAAPWNNLHPPVDGHGNWGSSTNKAASSRYTECKLSPFAWDCLLEDSDTWETTPNYDGSLQEPVELNVKVPYVLINGQEGVGVGYTTKIPSHNLRSIVEAIKILSKQTLSPKVYERELEKARKLLIPDFPSGTDIVSDEQLEQYLKTGAGGIRCRAKVSVGVQKRQGKAKDRPTLTFTCLPPGANPEKIGEQIKDALDKGRIEGVTEINDLSDLSGDRIEVVGKPGVNPDTLKSQIFLSTDLDSKFSAKILVIDGMKPVELDPVSLIQRWIEWRLDRLQVKFEKELQLKTDRLLIVEGLIRAIDKMDLIVKKIRASKTKAEAKEALMATPLKFTEVQTEAILEMRLRQLTGLDKEELVIEENALRDRINQLEVLSSDETEGIAARKSFMTSELSAIAKKHGEERRSLTIDPPAEILKSSSKAKATTIVSKPRFIKVDMKRGVVEQVKGPRGALVAESKDKVILMTEDGVLRKVPATFKGTISTSYSPVVIAKREAEVSTKVYLVVFTLEGQVKAMTMEGLDICKTTSTGKRWLPEGAKLLHFGESPYTVSWVSSRKKPVKLDLKVKKGKPGGKGIKIGDIKEVLLP